MTENQIPDTASNTAAPITSTIAAELELAHWEEHTLFKYPKEQIPELAARLSHRITTKYDIIPKPDNNSQSLPWVAIFPWLEKEPGAPLLLRKLEQTTASTGNVTYVIPPINMISSFIIKNKIPFGTAFNTLPGNTEINHVYNRAYPTAPRYVFTHYGLITLKDLAQYTYHMLIEEVRNVGKTTAQNLINALTEETITYAIQTS